MPWCRCDTAVLYVLYLLDITDKIFTFGNWMCQVELAGDEQSSRWHGFISQ